MDFLIKGDIFLKRITIEAIFQLHPSYSYEQQYEWILKQIQAGKIKPVKSSGINGKKPALYREYWLLEEKRDYNELLEELKYGLHPAISVDYYRTHPDIYEQERWAVCRLSDYLKKHEKSLNCRISVNERSFEIWGHEKFLGKGQGKRILKHCSLNMDFLNVYGTSEPLAYYAHTRSVPQNILILENKDTFYSMRRHLLESAQEQAEIFGVSIGTLIYGAGKGILKSFQDFDICIEPYMKAEGNSIFYFGDLDYEGIGIFESLSRLFEERWRVIPFIPAYEAMLEKAEQMDELPVTKEQQNRNIQELFFSYFSKEQVIQMKQILEQDRYIPQEILNITDFERKGIRSCSMNF